AQETPKLPLAQPLERGDGEQHAPEGISDAATPPERPDDGPDGGTAEPAGGQGDEPKPPASPAPAQERPGSGALSTTERDAVEAKAKDLYRALQEFGVSVSPVDHSEADIGPSLIRYKVRLRPGE